MEKSCKNLITCAKYVSQMFLFTDSFDKFMMCHKNIYSYFYFYLNCQFVHVSRNVMADENQVLVKQITKHLLSINGRKDWKKKNNCWRDTEQETVSNDEEKNLPPRQPNLAGQLVYVWRVWRWV